MADGWLWKQVRKPRVRALRFRTEIRHCGGPDLVDISPLDGGEPPIVAALGLIPVISGSVQNPSPLHTRSLVHALNPRWKARFVGTINDR